MTQQGVDSAAYEMVDDCIVEPRRQDRDAQVAGQQVPLQRADVVHAKASPR